MDISALLSRSDDHHPISCIEMHTTGEPVRIVYHGYPNITGTLLEQRAKARLEYDGIRQRLMFEPRGHKEMYGAILRSNTEYVAIGQAHIGVLFCHGEGYSTMCGHATVALGRFLVDTHDVDVFPRRESLIFDHRTKSTTVLLHAPCGVIEVNVPVLGSGGKSDPSRPVSFLSVPSFVSARDLQVQIPETHRWPELRHRETVHVSIAYGGAFYAIISASTLGFPSGLRIETESLDIAAMSRATALLRNLFMIDPELRKTVEHPDSEELSFLYSVMIVDGTVGHRAPGTKRGETGLCFFANQQIDRSPTGSCVAARVALAYDRGLLGLGEGCTYHSVVSNAFGGRGWFKGKIENIIQKGERIAVLVRTEGNAWYTGTSTFVVEAGDYLGESGFNLELLLKGKSES